MEKILEKLNTYKIHIRSWLIFIPIEILVVGLASGVFGSLGIYAVHYLLNILLFYICGDFIYPVIFKIRSTWIWKLPLSLLVIYACYLVISYFVDYNINKHTSWLSFDEIIFNSRYAFGVLWRALQFMGLSAFYYLFKEYNKTTLAKAQLEQVKLNSMLLQKEMEVKLSHARNAYLKAQINPHLLFNALSFIYTDILNTSPRAAEAVMTLSEIMRYSVHCEFTDDQILLKEEIEQVENLIKLHQTRFDNELNIEFRYEPEVKALKFIPLVLMTIVENIFKHSIYTDPNHKTILKLGIEKRRFFIYSSNSINMNRKKESFKKGLENIRQRLALAYGNDFSLNYQTKDNTFSLNIEVEI